jgi:hypothetical protein
VTLSLNGGVNIVPRQFDPVAFRLYSFAELAVLAIQPEGGPTYGGTTVTVFGRGFRDFGDCATRCTAFQAGPDRISKLSRTFLLKTSVLARISFGQAETPSATLWL